MADERVEDLTGGELTALASDDKFVVLDKSDTTDDADGTVKYIQPDSMGLLVLASEETGSPPDFTAVRNQLHPVDLKNGVTGLSDNGEVTFPATPVAGDRFGFFVSKENETDAGASPFTTVPFYCVEPATGTTIDGTSYTANGAGGGSIWSLWRDGELLVFRYIDATIGWIVDVDKRKPMACGMYLGTTTTGSEWTNITFVDVVVDTEEYDHGGIGDLAGNQFEIKRANVYSISGIAEVSPLVTDATRCFLQWTDGTTSRRMGVTHGSHSAAGGVMGVADATLSAAAHVSVQGWHNIGSDQNFAGGSGGNSAQRIRELLAQ